jgi:transcriptional regulator with XRE-family HTH domain
MIHKGEEVEKQIRISGKTKKSIATILNISRQTLDNWLLKPNLDTDKVNKIGNIIGYSFSFVNNTTYPQSQNNPSILNEPELLYKSREQQIITQQKYISMLEKYNETMSVEFPKMLAQLEQLQKEFDKLKKQHKPALH